MDLAAVVIESRDLEQVAGRVDHAPRREVVERGAPQHGFLAAGVHRDVAADAGGVRRCGIDGEHEAVRLGSFHHAPGDDPRAAANASVPAASTPGNAAPRLHRATRASRC